MCHVPFVIALDGKFVKRRDKLELGRSLADALKSLPHGGHGYISANSLFFSFLTLNAQCTLNNKTAYI